MHRIPGYCILDQTEPSRSARAPSPWMPEDALGLFRPTLDADESLVLHAAGSSGRIRGMLTIHILSFSFLEGHENQLVNDGAEPLVFLAVVPGPKA